MKELSLNVLDITENSVKAGATLIEILLEETEETLTVTVKDNGCGMTPEFLEQVKDPFCTSRTTRKVGLGIPLLLLAARQTGGDVEITSTTAEADPENHGTMTKGLFYKNHIDFTPLGDVISTVTTLIQGHADIDFLYRHTFGENEVSLDTRELRAVLEDVPLDSFEVLLWIKENLTEEYARFQ
jgi:hypothetical protein